MVGNADHIIILPILIVCENCKYYENVLRGFFKKK